MNCEECTRFSLEIKNTFAHRIDILSPPSPDHRCPLLRKIDFPKIVAENPSNLPRISFVKLDQLSQFRFYQLCFPVIRKKLWDSSTRTAHLGSKPVLYYASSVEFRNSYMPRYLLPSDSNIVFHLSSSLKFYYFNPQLLQFIQRMFVLNHTSLDMNTSQIDPKYLKFLLTNTVQYVWIHNCQIDFKDLITSLPPYIIFSYMGNVPNDWERLLLKHAPILYGIHLNPQRITNYKYLKMVLAKKILQLVSIETENFPVIKSRWNSHFRAKKPEEKPFLIIPQKNKTECYVIK